MTSAHQVGDSGPTPASSWAAGLGSLFRRVVLFEVQRGHACVAATSGVSSKDVGRQLSLAEPSPLRWCLEAASPLVSSGRSPSGAALARLLGLSPPRAYAVLPLVIDGKLIALAYIDNADEPFTLGAVGELFAYCASLLDGGAPHRQPSQPAPPVRSSARRRTGRFRRPRFIDPTSGAAAPEPSDSIAADELARRIAVEAEEASSSKPADEPLPKAPPAVPPPLPLARHEGEPAAEAPGAETLVVTPQGVVPASAAATPRRSRRVVLTTIAAAAAMAMMFALPLAPVGSAEGPPQKLAIPPSATVSEIAGELDARGLIRSSTAFQILARLTGSDRRLRAGPHTVSSGSWAWTVLSELEGGDVDMITVTVPEGLGLREIAVLLEGQGLGNRDSFIRAGRDRELLERYGIAADSAEGFLFPETYTLARGLPAREVIEIMLDQFFARFRDIPGAADLDPQEMVERVALASIIQREAKVSAEMPRIAGVFMNRLAENMRLESCATVQYILGKPKARLRLADLRIQSPYNTYLHEGLPPGPIANPGRPALAAALAPEKHDYLFFVAREDGSGRHVFTKSFTAHQAVARRVQTKE